jgi:hypothetical protein
MYNILQKKQRQAKKKPACENKVKIRPRYFLLPMSVSD